MSISISELTIEELWGYQTFRIPIKDNKLVLVGENGTGKSTVANLIYFFLTCQWEKINDFDFKAIALVINDENLSISKENLSNDLETWKRDTPSIYEGIKNLIMESSGFSEDDIPQYLEDDNKLKSLSHKLKVPISLIPLSLIRTSLKKTRKEKSYPSKTILQKVDNTIKEVVKEEILYLPTYRRIEQEFKENFPELYKRKLSRRKTQTDYVELV